MQIALILFTLSPNSKVPLILLFSSVCCYPLLTYWFEPLFLLPVSLFVGTVLCLACSPSLTMPRCLSVIGSLLQSSAHLEPDSELHIKLFSTTSSYFFSDIPEYPSHSTIMHSHGFMQPCTRTVDTD